MVASHEKAIGERDWAAHHERWRLRRQRCCNRMAGDQLP